MVGGTHRERGGETERVATYGDMDAGEGSAAATEGECADGGCTAEGVGMEASRDAVMNVSGRGDGASNGDAWPFEGTTARLWGREVTI